ncbi:MAG: transposase [bacterium]|nr:transposase [bacterium]
MPRTERVDVGGLVYHVTNRSNGRHTIFDANEAYNSFEIILVDAKTRFDMRILAYVLMPNHWHLLIYPKEDGDLSAYVAWLTNTHTRRYHVMTGTVGGGHLYQGRYKSFLVGSDRHLLTVLKYIERNPVRAKLSKLPESWRWGSAYRRIHGKTEEKKLLASSPVPLPSGYGEWIHTPEPTEELAAIRSSVNKGIPYGRKTWRDRIITKYSLEQVLRPPGRPKKS